MTDDLNMNIQETVASICSSLHGKIRSIEESMLLLRLMEFCSGDGTYTDVMFRTMAEEFSIPDSQYDEFLAFVTNKPTKHVKLHHIDGFNGTLKTLLDEQSGLLIFTYMGDDTVLLNDVPVLQGTYQVWLQSSVLKGSSGTPVYYSSVIDVYNQENGVDSKKIHSVEFCGRDINFRFPNSDNA